MEIQTSTAVFLEGYFDEIRMDYSGRGMYGKECFGIVTGESLWNVRGELEEIRKDYEEDGELYDDLCTLLENEPSEDSMGMDRIYYWTRVQVVADDTDED